ncbi:hypothetical protein V5O48_017853, partial [Marasmius crinis-equi]
EEHLPAFAGPSTSLDESDRSEMAAAAALEALILEAIAEGKAEEPPPSPPSLHWIVHPKLAGLTIEVNVNSNKSQMVRVVRTSTGEMEAHRVRSRSSFTIKVNDLNTISRSSNAIKPGSEKLLMVVVGGKGEHIGKLVRQISHFYLDEKNEENHLLILGVIEKDSQGKESLTPHCLELHTEVLARAEESHKNRRNANEYMREQQPTAKINYLHIVDKKKKIPLNLAHPVKKGDLYDFQPNVSYSFKELRALPPEHGDALVPGTPQWSPEEVLENARAGAAWDPNDPAYPDDGPALPYDPWNDVPIPPLSEEEHPPAFAGPSTSLDESDRSEMAAAAALEASILEAIAEGEAEEPPPSPPSPHWIVHPKLAGLTIEVNVDSNKSQMVRVVRTSTGEMEAHRVRSRSSFTIKVNDLNTISRSSNAIKPGSEKSLMVVVGGEEEHIGKLVRQISHFYLDEKNEENHLLILGVIEKDSQGKESLTPHRLELHAEVLARAEESNENRRNANEYMREVRDSARTENSHRVHIRSRFS